MLKLLHVCMRISINIAKFCCVMQLNMEVCPVKWKCTSEKKIPSSLVRTWVCCMLPCLFSFFFSKNYFPHFMSHNLFDGWIYALTAKVCLPSIFTRDEMPVCISPHNHKLKTSTSMHHKSQDQTTVWISLQKLNSRKNRPLANFINLPACKVTDTFLKTS